MVQTRITLLPQPFDSSRQTPPVLAHGPERATHKVSLAERAAGFVKWMREAKQKVKVKTKDKSEVILEERKRFQETTIASTVLQVSVVMEFAMAKGYIQKNNVAPYKFTAPKEEVTVYSMKELETFFKKAQELNTGLFNQCICLLLTGIRADESCHFLREYVHFDEGYIEYHNEKGKRVEQIPLTPVLADFFRTLPKDYAPFAFRYRDRHNLGRDFREIRNKAELRRTLKRHTLKKTYADAIYDSSYDVVTTSSLAHHSSTEVTIMHYIQRAKMDRKRAVLAEAQSQFAPLVKSAHGLRLVKRQK